MSKVKFRSHEVEQGKTQPATNAFLHLTIELKRWRLHVGPTYVGRRHASGFKSETNQVIWDLTFPWKFKQAHCRSHQPLNAMGRPCESTTPHRRSSPTQWRSPSCWWSSHRSRTEPRRTSPGTTCGGSKVQETPGGENSLRSKLVFGNTHLCSWFAIPCNSCFSVGWMDNPKKSTNLAVCGNPIHPAFKNRVPQNPAIYGWCSY